jgi:hypothetical protein
MPCRAAKPLLEDIGEGKLIIRLISAGAPLRFIKYSSVGISHRTRTVHNTGLYIRNVSVDVTNNADYDDARLNRRLTLIYRWSVYSVSLEIIHGEGDDS